MHPKTDFIISKQEISESVRFIYTLLFALCFGVGQSQILYHSTKVPVTDNSRTLSNPWTGGADALQYSPINFNNDGLMDLFVFDRVGNRINCFVNTGSNGVASYRYAPEYLSCFPALENWALIRDYNKDGIPDLYTYTNLGGRVLKGKITNGKLSFDEVCPLLKFKDLINNGYFINIFISSEDIPGIEDVDGDGDLDVVTFGNGSAYVEYYQNLTIEKGFALDSFIFDSDHFDLCWGRFTESLNNNSVYLGACKADGIHGGANNASRHSGSTICLFDRNGDGDEDILLGDVSFSSMVYLENGGDSTYANMISYDSIYPKYNVPVNLQLFPAAFILDVDNDGKNDMLVGQNARNTSSNTKNSIFYKNVGLNVNYTFAYQSDSFLIDGMLDFGSESKPVAFDYNGDGLMDLVVSNFNYYPQNIVNPVSQLALLENTGTATAPAFKLVDRNYSSLSQYTLRSGSPTFGDLDGDGLQDMLVGDYTGSMHFFKNAGTSTAASFPSMTTPYYFGVDVGVSAVPTLFDVNGDGKLDIVCGKQDGKLNYYKNFGTTTIPAFHADSVITQFGKINVQGIYDVFGASAPVLKQNGTDVELYVGAYNGFIYKYKVNMDTLTGTFARLDTNAVRFDAGLRATPAIADFNGDGINDIVVGNGAGGLSFFSSINEFTAIDDIRAQAGVAFSLYPNPATDVLNIIFDSEENTGRQVQILSVIGQKVFEKSADGNVLKVDVEAFTPGIYFVTVSSKNRVSTQRVVIR